MCGVCVCGVCVCVCVVCVVCVCVFMACVAVGALYCLHYSKCHDSCWSKATYLVFKHSVRTALQIHSASVIKTSQLILYRYVIALCSPVQIKQINTLCEQNVALLNVKLGVQSWTPGPYRTQCNTIDPIFLLYSHMNM